MSSSASSSIAEIATNIVFGITATIISIVTVWQGHKVWKMWRAYTHGDESVAPEIELGFGSFRSTPPSPEGQDLGEVIASSPSSADQGGEAAPVPVPVQIPRIQGGVPTIGAAVTILDSDLDQRAQVDSNEVRGRHPENENPISTSSNLDLALQVSSDCEEGLSSHDENQYHVSISPSPDLIQRAWIDSNEASGGHAETNMECQEVHDAINIDG